MPNKQRNDQYKSEGRCPNCTKKHSDGTIWCEQCREKRRVTGDKSCLDCGTTIVRDRPGVRIADRCPSCKKKRSVFYAREYYKKNSDKRREYYRKRARKFRAENRRTSQDRDIRRRYKVTLEHCESLIDGQGGGCAICGKQLPRLDGSKKDRRLVHIDHNHNTNTVRGILCSRCNIGLGFFNEDYILLHNAADYLNRFN